MTPNQKRLLERYKIQCKEVDRSVERMARADKRAYIDKRASQAENVANRGEQGKVYKIIKLVSGKYGKVAPVNDLQGRLLTTVWEQKRAPDDWTKGIIVKIHKKGALSDYNNWRGVTLLSTPCRILAKIYYPVSRLLSSGSPVQ